MSCVLKRRKKRKEKLMERETPRQQQQHRDHHCHSETSELKNKNVLQSREREASHKLLTGLRICQRCCKTLF